MYTKCFLWIIIVNYFSPIVNMPTFCTRYRLYASRGFSVPPRPKNRYIPVTLRIGEDFDNGMNLMVDLLLFSLGCRDFVVNGVGLKGSFIIWLNLIFKRQQTYHFVISIKNINYEHNSINHNSYTLIIKMNGCCSIWMFSPTIILSSLNDFSSL